MISDPPATLRQFSQWLKFWTRWRHLKWLPIYICNSFYYHHQIGSCNHLQFFNNWGTAESSVPSGWLHDCWLQDFEASKQIPWPWWREVASRQHGTVPWRYCHSAHTWFCAESGLLYKQLNTCELAVSEFPKTPHQVLNGLVKVNKVGGHVR